MAQTIKLKRSSQGGAEPTPAQLDLGELAINTNDGKIYLKKNVAGTEDIVKVNPDDLSEFNNDMWEVTTTVPTDGSGKPTGYVWYIV